MRKDSNTETLSPEKSIADIADELVGLTNNLVKTAQTHDDLRIGFEKILEPALKDIGIESITPRYERLGEHARTIYSGRPDAVHGSIIIEYEPTNAFKSEKSVSDAYLQLVDYIEKESKGLAKDEQTTYKFMGVGFDGLHIFFVERKGKNTVDEKFVSTDVYEFNFQSAKTFLTYLRALSRLPLTAENLAQTFGPSSSLAPKAVSALVDALENWGNKRVRVFFNEWKRLFGIVYGERFNSAQKNEALVLREYYNVRKQADVQELLFCVHTYFALLMKFIAAELLTLKDSALRSSFTLELTHGSTEELKNKLIDIENGGVYAREGINNFLEGDFFSWYLDAWSPGLEEAIRDLARHISEFEPATSIIDPESTRDLLKKLYEYLVPKEIRHKLGEYYTPDWLAEYILNEAGYTGDVSKQLLDPACGSGTFLVLAIKRAKNNLNAQKESCSELVQKITQNIWGFDLNPLAVIAARTNYLFALGNLIEAAQPFDIPIYLTDSVLTPSKTKASLYGEALEVGTSVGYFHIPPQWTDNGGLLLNRALPAVEQMVKNHYSVEEVTDGLLHRNLITYTNEAIAHSFCRKILELEQDGKNGIWTRFLKNAFAPVIGGKFDFVIGNPPWIRWNYLSLEYRKATMKLWKDYGLFSLKGLDSILGGGVKDFSMLFTYVAADSYLKESAVLAFLITQEVFKSKGAGEGFRRFQIGDKKHLKVIKAYDLVQVKPFEAANKTAAIILKKGEKTEYPVPYEVWKRKKGISKISPELLLEEVLSSVDIEQLIAKPIGSDVGQWQTKSSTLADNNLEGTNYYKSVRGTETSPYGIFWLEIKKVRSDGNLIVRNLRERGSTNLRSIECAIEPDFIFPAVAGSDIMRWATNSHNYVLIVQDPKKRIGWPEGLLKKDYPLTYEYLLNFKDELLSRATLKRFYANKRAPFYTQFNISEATFSHHKVVWGRMSNDVAATVVSDIKTIFGYKNVTPLDTTAFMSTESEDEAHYICSIINSTIIRDFIKSFSSPGRGFGAPSTMSHLNISKFDPRNELHLKLANASKRLHEEKTAGRDDAILDLEKQINPLILELFAQKEGSISPLRT